MYLTRNAKGDHILKEMHLFQSKPEWRRGLVCTSPQQLPPLTKSKKSCNVTGLHVDAAAMVAVVLTTVVVYVCMHAANPEWLFVIVTAHLGPLRFLEEFPTPEVSTGVLPTSKGWPLTCQAGFHWVTNWPLDDHTSFWDVYIPVYPPPPPLYDPMKRYSQLERTK